MAHHGLNGFGRTTFQQIIVQRDALGSQHSTHVRAGAFALLGRVHFIDFRRRNAVLAGQAQNRIANVRICQNGVLVEHRRDENRKDQRGHQQKRGCGHGSPNVPGARQPPHDAEQRHHHQAAQHDAEPQALELIDGPLEEILVHQVVFLFAEEPFIDSERRADDRCDRQILREI